MKKIKYPKKNQKNRARGFSFGETLLATFVLSVGLISVVKLFQVSVSQSIFLREATIASELSQEGVELVRNVRDRDFVAGGNGFTTFSESNPHCYIAINSTNLTCFADQNNAAARYTLRITAGEYRSSAGAGNFRRYVYVNYNSGLEKATVTSFVVWDGRALPPSSGSPANCSIQNKCVYTESVLTNWNS